jgi:hypothetical protein
VRDEAMDLVFTRKLPKIEEGAAPAPRRENRMGRDLEYCCHL